MRNFQNTFETRKRSFISVFTICMTVPLIKSRYLADLCVKVSMFYEIIFVKPTGAHSERSQRPKMEICCENSYQLSDAIFAKKIFIMDLSLASENSFGQHLTLTCPTRIVFAFPAFYFLLPMVFYMPSNVTNLI